MEKVVVDTNVLIHFLTTPQSELESLKVEKVRRLLERIESGAISAILPEVVLHEMFYTLTGKRFPDTHLPTLAVIVATILDWPGWEFSELDLAVYHRAIEILLSDPRLEYSDAVIAARAEAHGAVLATFDKRLADTFGGTIWAES